MNKRIITGLIVLMVFSILGIIMVQWIWMNHAIRVKNELFNRSVVEALQFTASRIEKIRDVDVITSISMDDSLTRKPAHYTSVHSNSQNVFKLQSGANKAAGASMSMVIGSGKNGKLTWAASSDSDSLHGNKIHKIYFQSETDDGRVDSLLSTGIVMIDSLVSTISNLDLIVPGIKKKIVYKAVNLKKVANEVVTEIISSENTTPDTGKIHQILSEKLIEENIPIPFHMGIIRDSMLLYRTGHADSTLLMNSPYRAAMFPNDILDKNLSLAVYFPGKEKFIYKNINWLPVISMVLSLMVLSTFATGIFFVLKQKKISEMKSDFINNMTHEFKTPIATISVAADSILNEKVITEPEKIRNFTGMIKKENSRMNRQVEDILTIARLDKKDFEFKWELVNIHELLEEAIQGILLRVEAKKGTISTNFNAVNPIITCDRNHCANVIYNLLDNAIKYTTVPPDIIIETRNTNNGLIFSVQDKGIGMSKAVQNKIFEKFYRQTIGNIHNVKGFGLGLSYVKAVTEANKGMVTVKSEPGKGSRFEVFIPFVRE